MNEKIKLLAESAMGTRKHVPPVWQFYDVELEKFADLLVFECIKLAVFKGDSETARAIKEHFELK